MTEGVSAAEGRQERSGRGATWWAGSLTSTPHLTSPLRGGVSCKMPNFGGSLIRLYLVDIRVQTPDLPFCRRLLGGGRDELGKG